MLVTLPGITTFTNPVPEKAIESKTYTVSGIVTLVRELQNLKAPSTTPVTVLPISIFFAEVTFDIWVVGVGAAPYCLVPVMTPSIS